MASLALSTQEVLHDLTTARGLVDWRLQRIANCDVIVGRALSDRLQDNRLQRKRKQRGGSTSTIDESALSSRSRCSFVVMSTAQEPALSVERLMDLHAAASALMLELNDGRSFPVERVYLCLSDAGTVSYYHVATGFPPFSLVDS